MNRRSFIKQMSLAGTLPLIPYRPNQTKHLILIVNGGGARKKDYYEHALLAPNVRRVASDGFVFEQDHCERVWSHDAAFAELTGGHELLRRAIRVPSLQGVPRIMRQKRPQTLICRQTTHDVAHENYENYLTEVRSTDDAIGKVFDWVKSDAYFSQNTAIVIRPEFGRDDEVNADGHLHHSYGFYYAHRVASIFWGPDFNRGVDRETVITSLDMAPTIAALFDAGAMSARSRIAPGLFRFA